MEADREPVRGFQTILFGRKLLSVKAALKLIKGFGFNAVEFFQNPKNILDGETGEPVPFEKLCADLVHEGLALAGLAGGSLLERLKYCAGRTALDPSQFYLYVDDLDEPSIQEALSSGYRIGLHSHAFTKYQRIASVLDHPLFHHESVFLIPDTAHLVVAGDDPVEVLRSVDPKKVLVVHLKDWDPAYGRARNAYARGFCPLGSGRVPLNEVCSVMNERGMRDWVWELDYSQDDLVTSIRASALWLKEQQSLGFGGCSPVDICYPVTSHAEDAFSPLGISEIEFMQRLLSAEQRGLDRFYSEAAKALELLYRARHVSIWAVSQERGAAYLMADSKGTQAPKHETFSRLQDTPFQKSIKSLEPEIIRSFQPRKAPWIDWVESSGATQLTTLAVASTYNPHEVRLIVGVLSGRKPSKEFEHAFEHVESILSHALNYALSDARGYVEGRVNQLRSGSRNVDGFCESLSLVISELLAVETASVFVENMTGRLVCSTPSAVEWNHEIQVQAHHYARDDTQCPTVQSWLQGLTVFIQDESAAYWRREWRSRNRTSITMDEVAFSDVLIAPIWATGKAEGAFKPPKVIGVVRCKNKLRDSQAAIGRFLTDDDAALLAAICEDVAPQLELLLCMEYLENTVKGMIHTLKTPIGSLKSELEAVSNLASSVSRAASQSTRKPLTPEQKRVVRQQANAIDDRVRLLGARLARARSHINNTGFTPTLGLSEIALSCEELDLCADVVCPVLEQIPIDLVDQGLDPSVIQLEVASALPKVWGDRDRLQQVLTELLQNAIKYACGDPANDLRIRLSCGSDGESAFIVCSDNGIGIDAGCEEEIFNFGFRGPSAEAAELSGFGVGLWNAKRIMDAHKGSIRVVPSNSEDDGVWQTMIEMGVPLASRRRA